MKPYMKYFVAFVTFVALCEIKLFAQTPPLGGWGVDSATLYLTGTFKNYNPQRAFQINLQNANSGNAKAMNAVGMHYTKGLGVDSNSTLAAYWFTQAATNGYTKSLVNLGMLYKHNANDSAGYSIACNYFNQALQVNEPSAIFAMGYMYYKGLGCTQSYTQALNLFNQGIAINQSNCMYFKGLCYKYGYGVTANNDSSLFYIDSAAKLGYKQANAELNNNAASFASSRSLRETKTNQQQETRNDEFISVTKSNKSIELNGSYTGEILQYDYSGKKLLAQIPITLSFAQHPSPIGEGQGVRLGELILNNTQTIQLQAIQQGNQLIFTQTTFASSAPLRSLRETNFILKSLTIQAAQNPAWEGNEALNGSLILFNTYTHETDKPINIKLRQVNCNQQPITRNELTRNKKRETDLTRNGTNEKLK